ncbi:MAG: hypothetical protein A3G45_03330 [Candidatus Staskawiczbacteria bacterium RIFCSPLOWO2_12_FULL_37_15]|uniref:Nudix hydrolase domain-containing protein n=1 Tax=Candidatus Staskawiczbacteria bacterium RIFCSPLOWO2_12_FULL_37_15 TaxID=1802218 RepID=A0A1G2IM83_9BACT|nr:MAG: Isopentenyldiphosphate isomerase [Parcubacteria group bacterium GW2011_GWA2_37_10]OGZ75677.1 MAG: hypothetical protein A3G45_03330 [Candidatus Staskawiczbacteria bacterium RIFCSPLOWO2_12_FULL_37_15]
MEKNKTISVWLTIISGRNKGKIILQKRSSANKTFPYICQATWAGKVKIGEDVESAIKRECVEELGESFFNAFNFLVLKIFSEDKFIMNGAEWTCYNYVGDISNKILKLIRLHSEALPEFILIDSDSEIFPVKSEKNSKNNIVLFDDQYKVLKEIINGN